MHNSEEQMIAQANLTFKIRVIASRRQKRVDVVFLIFDTANPQTCAPVGCQIIGTLQRLIEHLFENDPTLGIVFVKEVWQRPVSQISYRFPTLAHAMLFMMQLCHTRAVLPSMPHANVQLSTPLINYSEE